MGSQKTGNISIQDSRKQSHRQTSDRMTRDREMRGHKISVQVRQREVSGGQARLGRLGAWTALG